MSNVDSENHRTDDENVAVSDERKRKQGSLRSVEADLKVIVGQETVGDDNNIIRDGRRQVYWHFSQTLAYQSSYVDTLLSTRLPTTNDSNPSQDHKEIVFTDIEPSQWERMMQFLDDPYSMTVEDVFELVPIYDQYGFKTGIKICDGVLCDKALFAHQSYSDITVCDPSRADQCVQAIVLSQKMSMRKTFYFGRRFLSFVFRDTDMGPSESVGFPLTISQLSQLVPTIIRDGELRTSSNAPWVFFNDEKRLMTYLNGAEEEIGLNLKEEIGTSFDITNPLFPELFIAKKEIECAKKFANDNIKRIDVVFGDFGNAAPSGSYYKCYDSDCYIHESLKDWKLGRHHESNRWVMTYCGEYQYQCGKSELAHVPPNIGWARWQDKGGSPPILKYICL